MGKSSSDSSSSSDSEKEKKDKKEKKNTKQKKAKQVIASPATFSKRYAGLFNNKKHSDFTITIGSETLAAHKLILQGNSEFFEKLEGDSFSFPTEDDAAAAKSLIKFYYEGVFEYTEESAVVIFTILANKYKTKNFNEFKLPAKVLLNGVIAYVEKDLTNRVGEFEKLCESVDFKKMEKEDLTKLYAKKKWLQKSSSFLNQIILKDMDDSEEEGSDKSDKDSEEEEEEEDDEEEGSSKVPELDLKLSHSSYASSYNKKTKIYSMSTGSWYACIAKKPCDKYAVEFGSNCSPVMVGFIPKEKFQQNYTSNYSTGHNWYVSSSYLYGPNQTSGASYSGGSYSQGSVIGVEFFRKKGIIGYYCNGTYIKDAFTITDKKTKFYPMLDVCGSGVSFKFVKPKFKKIKK